MEDTVQITAEVTPNPHTLKFNVGKTLLESGSLNYTDRDKAKESLLASKLFENENVLGVMIGTSFVTVTKAPAAQWQNVVEPVTKIIKDLLATDQKLFPQASGVKSDTPPAGNSEIETKIREVLDNEIRPAVAMDGGDIIFYGYDNGVVTLHLQGSCSSCPSSVMTLKMGVENRLKSLIPEVREVVQV